MDSINRRAFLMSSALGASGAMAAAGAMIPAAAVAETTPPVAGDTYRLTRDIPVESGFDLVVAGGGPAGAAAAVCAAWLGAKVVLLEATGCLGGMGTSGLVSTFPPMADGQEMLIGGLMRVIMQTMQKRGFLAPYITPDVYQKQVDGWTHFNPEGYKLVLDELITASGVEVRFFTRLVDADADAAQGTVRGVVAHNVEGFRYLKAKMFIDCTGDAVLANACGAKCREAGRDTPHIMPATLGSLETGIDWKRAKSSPTKTGPDHQQETVARAIADGFFTQPDPHLAGLRQAGELIGVLNGGHLYNLNALRCRSLSDGVMLGRKIAQEYVAFYRKYVPGCENIELVTTASLVGVRESRRIVGEYELNFNDYKARRQFPDQVAMFNGQVDIHPYDLSKAEFARWKKEYFEIACLKPGERYGIPYGILAPKGWRNLWAAGRCHSADVMVNGAIRVQPVSAMLGQAAGTAAVQCLKTGQTANDLDTTQLVETLRANGAYLPQKDLRKTMTRSA